MYLCIYKFIVFDDETPLSIDYMSFRQIFGCFPSYHYVGCNHYLHKKCFEQLEKNIDHTFTCPACRRKCNFYTDIVSFNEIEKKMRLESHEKEIQFSKKITHLDDLLLYSLEINKKEITESNNDLEFISDIKIDKRILTDDSIAKEVLKILKKQDDAKHYIKTYNVSQYKLLLSKSLALVGSIETLEIAMREDTAIQHSALLFKDGINIGIKHEHRKLLHFLMNKVFEYNLNCIEFNDNPFSFYFATLCVDMCHNILTYFFILLNHIITSDGIIKSCEIASQLAYMFVIYDSLLILHLITPTNIGIYIYIFNIK